MWSYVVTEKRSQASDETVVDGWYYIRAVALKKQKDKDHTEFALGQTYDREVRLVIFDNQEDAFQACRSLRKIYSHYQWTIGVCELTKGILLNSNPRVHTDIGVDMRDLWKQYTALAFCMIRAPWP